MINYNYEEEKGKHPYNYYGKVIEEKHDNGTFLLQSALEYVIDDYDESIGSVERSHYADLGYFEVVNFNLEDDARILDLSWMKKNDVFCLEKNNQIPFIQEIIVNIDNLGYSYLPISDDQIKDITLVVRGFNSQNNIIQQIKDFKYFIKRHARCLKSIKLEGFSKIIESILNVYAKKCGVEVEFEKENNKQL